MMVYCGQYNMAQPSLRIEYQKHSRNQLVSMKWCRTVDTATIIYFCCLIFLGSVFPSLHLYYFMRTCKQFCSLSYTVIHVCFGKHGGDSS